MNTPLAALAVAASVLLAFNGAEAQQIRKIPRIGFLAAGGSQLPETFVTALNELGYANGKNVTVEYRSREGRREGWAELAAEFVQLKVDMIVALDPPAAGAARKASGTISIVMRTTADPVKDGWVASLARPGGNITGLYSESDELLPKRLELIKEVRPRLERVAVLQNRDFANTAQAFRELETAAKGLGLELQALDVRAPSDFDPALRGAVKNRSQALTTIRAPLIVFERERIAALAIKHKLAAIYDDREFVDAGGLVSYGTNLQDLYRRAASYVHKILKGTKPADLPVEQPKKFEFVVNLKAAKQIGLTIPPNVLGRADRVIK